MPFRILLLVVEGHIGSANHVLLKQMCLMEQSIEGKPAVPGMAHQHSIKIPGQAGRFHIQARL